MDFYVILIIAHIVSAILGVGGATFIEIHLNKGKHAELKTDVLVTRIGMALGLLSGLGFILMYFLRGQLMAPSSVLFSETFWIKMGLFVVIVINAFLLHKHKISLFWGSALSFVTWWYVMLLGIFLTEGVKYPWYGVIAVYLVLLVGGAYGLHYLRERSKAKLAAITPPPSPAAHT